jgi:hypothetical protein
MPGVEKRHIAFVDVLGIRSALAGGNLAVAERKVLQLAEAVEDTLSSFPSVRAHGATDFFLLWSDDENAGWRTAQAAVTVFQRYFDLNESENVRSIHDAYLIRGGLAYGPARQEERLTDRFSYSLSLGDGLAKAYEAQAKKPGMRLFIDRRASAAFRPLLSEETDAPSVRIDKIHDATGAIACQEIRWAGSHADAERRVPRAANLFRDSLRAFKKRDVPERVVEHYQQTLCTLLRGASNPRVLLSYLVFRHRQRRFHQFLAPVWATAWLRLVRPANAESLPDLRDALWEKFLAMSGTRVMGDVATALSLRNRWKPLLRFLRTGVVRFGPRRQRKARA